MFKKLTSYYAIHKPATTHYTAHKIHQVKNRDNCSNTIVKQLRYQLKETWWSQHWNSSCRWYCLMACSHDSTTVSRPLRQNNQCLPKLIMKRWWLVDNWWVYSTRSRCEYLPSAWQLHDDWFMTSCSHVISHVWKTTSRQVDCDSMPGWAWFLVILELCCCVNSDSQAELNGVLTKGLKGDHNTAANCQES